MPRARFEGKLIRIPSPADIAYELTLQYPPSEGDTRTIKQRLIALAREDPSDIKLYLLKEKLEKMQNINHPWGRKFRNDPAKGYKEEAEAVERALNRRRDLEKCDSKILSEFPDR